MVSSILLLQTLYRSLTHIPHAERIIAAHIMFNDQLLSHLVEIAFAHLPEAVPNFLLDELLFFLDKYGESTIRLRSFLARGIGERAWLSGGRDLLRRCRRNYS